LPRHRRHAQRRIADLAAVRLTYRVTEPRAGAGSGRCPERRGSVRAIDAQAAEELTPRGSGSGSPHRPLERDAEGPRPRAGRLTPCRTDRCSSRPTALKPIAMSPEWSIAMLAVQRHRFVSESLGARVRCGTTAETSRSTRATTAPSEARRSTPGMVLDASRDSPQTCPRCLRRGEAPQFSRR